MGIEFFVDATGCDAPVLRSRRQLSQLLGRIVRELRLSPLSDVWHSFPAPGAGVTGLILLTESHLTIHTFPESGTATLNLYCCRRRPDWPWKERLAECLGASGVHVRKVRRG